MAVRIVAHDPFTRKAIARETAVGESIPCGWCGNTPHVMYRYQTVRDDHNGPPITRGGRSRPFCNLTCYRAFSF